VKPSDKGNTGAQAPTRQQIYENLMGYASQMPNSVWLAQIIASWQLGQGVLPDALGLKASQFQQLLDSHFPGYALAPQACSGVQSDFSRLLEKDDLKTLLNQFASNTGKETDWLADMLIAACLGSDHLWQDLGLWSRNDLSALLRHNFPELVKRNSKDMKWKKFLYKQLCEAEGLYVCRAPSCDVCKDYDQCFGAED